MTDHASMRAGRLERLRAALHDAEVSQLLVTNLLNVRWLTGFTGSNAQVLVGPGSFRLLTDSRYAEQVASEVTGVEAEVVIAGPAKGDRANDHILRLCEGPSLWFESDHLTVAALEGMQKAFDEADRTSVELHGADDLIAQLRQTKDPAEVRSLELAAGIADDALAATLGWISAGQDEQRVARQLEWEMAERGSERPSFETILASGPNGAKPHARPSERVLEDGDLVVIDFGATVDGYGSDMTRSLVVGGNPTAAQQRWYANVLDAQQAGVAASVVDAELKGIHETTLEHLQASGQEGVYAHGTGHGVGLYIHENPILSVRAEGTVIEAMALTVEPGAYIPGVGGIRVEDLLITTADGPQTITNFPKGLSVD